MLFNYGALPQTWEDPSHTHPDTGFPGDNDPIDAVEIGTKQWHTGAVVSVRAWASTVRGVGAAYVRGWRR